MRSILAVFVLLGAATIVQAGPVKDAFNGAVAIEPAEIVSSSKPQVLTASQVTTATAVSADLAVIVGLRSVDRKLANLTETSVAQFLKAETTLSAPCANRLAKTIHTNLARRPWARGGLWGLTFGTAADAAIRIWDMRTAKDPGIVPLARIYPQTSLEE